MFFTLYRTHVVKEKTRQDRALDGLSLGLVMSELDEAIVQMIPTSPPIIQKVQNPKIKATTNRKKQLEVGK